MSGAGAEPRLCGKKHKLTMECSTVRLFPVNVLPQTPLDVSVDFTVMSSVLVF